MILQTWITGAGAILVSLKDKRELVQASTKFWSMDSLFQTLKWNLNFNS